MNFDNDKLCSMLMANIAHFMDPDIMHIFVQLCETINEFLRDKDIVFQLIYERNHGNFFLNMFDNVLDILIEEAVLRFNEYNSLDSFDFLSEEDKKQFRIVTNIEFT